MILDDDHSNARKVTHRTGFSFAIPVVIVGAIIGLFGLLSILFVSLVGAVMVVVGGFLATSSYGFQLDVKRNRCREYTSNFFDKARYLAESRYIAGCWHSLGKDRICGAKYVESRYREYRDKL